MKKFLPYEEWEDYVPKSVGRVRVNHSSADCAGDSDSMLVERRVDGTFSAHCFRCGRSGWHRPVAYFTPIAKESSSADSGSGVVTAKPSGPAEDASPEWGAFPRHVKLWLMDAGISPVISEAHGFKWSDSKGWLYINVEQWQPEGYRSVGHVVRKFPKGYLTLAKDKEHFYGWYRTTGAIDSDTVVLVEDVVSAIRVSEICDSVALLGVNVSNAVLTHLLRTGYKRAAIFLDGDNPAVRLAARKIAKKLSWMETRIVETGMDPKRHSKEELDRLLSW